MTPRNYSVTAVIDRCEVCLLLARRKLVMHILLHVRGGDHRFCFERRVRLTDVRDDQTRRVRLTSPHRITSTFSELAPQYQIHERQQPSV